MKTPFDIDHDLLLEYGISDSFTKYIDSLPDIEVQIQYPQYNKNLLKLLMLLDNVDQATLKLIQTYLDLRIGG